MNPDISEFSYGYALTETIVAAGGARLRAAPIFPSLIEEGKAGGGFDVHIPFAGVPIFLQFKLSHCMVRDSAIEVRKGVQTTPFYRMHLRPTKHSQQHPLLLSLEGTGAAVYYAAPFFHTPAELNDAYAKRLVVQRSLFLKPSDIGPLPDDKDHHIAFRRGSPCYFCSDTPRPIREAETEPTEFLKDLRAGFASCKGIQPTENSAREWADRIVSVVKEHRRYINWATDERFNALRGRNPAWLLAYLASTFLGCSVIVVALSDKADVHEA